MSYKQLRLASVVAETADPVHPPRLARLEANVCEGERAIRAPLLRGHSRTLAQVTTLLPEQSRGRIALDTGRPRPGGWAVFLPRSWPADAEAEEGIPSFVCGC